MYKKVKQYAQNMGLAVDERAGLSYGLINGYFVLIEQCPGTDAKHNVYLWAKPGNIQPVPATLDYLNQCTSRFEYLQSTSYNGAKITAQFQGLGFKWGKNYVPCLDGFLKEITGYCQNNGLMPCCESCGTEYGLNLYQVDGISHMFCSGCYQKVSGQIQENTTRKKQQGSGNVIGGIIGALLGSLLGVAAWVLIYQAGYISALGGLLMVICAMKGYELLGGRLNALGITITCIISVAMLFVSEYLCLGIEVYKAYNEYTRTISITFMGALEDVPLFLTEPEIAAAVFKDLAIGLVLMVFGAFGTVKQTYKSNTGSVNTRMVAPVTKGAPMTDDEMYTL